MGQDTPYRSRPPEEIALNIGMYRKLEEVIALAGVSATIILSHTYYTTRSTGREDPNVVSRGEFLRVN